MTGEPAAGSGTAWSGTWRRKWIDIVQRTRVNEASTSAWTVVMMASCIVGGWRTSEMIHGRRTGGRADRRMDGWMDGYGWIDRWMDGWMDMGGEVDEGDVTRARKLAQRPHRPGANTRT